MPSSFPGMGPWLEGPDAWGDIHAGLTAAAKYQLNKPIRTKYLARVEQRLHVVPNDAPTLRGQLVADVRTARNPGRPYHPKGDTAIGSRPPVPSDLGARLRQKGLR